MLNEITGVIDHRILLNYRVDPAVMQRQLPDSFRVKLVEGWAIGGICQVSLSDMRPKGVPAFAGSRSHNAAHRIAVTSSQGEGVYVPRRDTDSWLNRFSGGRIFPGVYSKAKFEVTSKNGRYTVDVAEGGTRVMRLDAAIAEVLPAGSIFPDTESVSQFFAGGNIGWSDTEDGKSFDTIELVTPQWNMQPLKVAEEFSAYFSDTDKFPAGSVEFDCAMVMLDLTHRWVSRPALRELCC